jgi:hypothetical protein
MLSYDPRKYIEREPLIRNVVAKHITNFTTEGRSRPAVVFDGWTGIGKSWHLRHLEQSLGTDLTEYHCILIDLSDFLPDFMTAWDEAMARTIMARVLVAILGQLEIDIAPESGPEAIGNLSRQLEKEIKVGRPVLLLVDGVIESPEMLLKLLETHLLNPLTSPANVLIVMAGLSWRHRWVNPQLRQPTLPLQPFDSPEKTYKQLLRQWDPDIDYAAAEEIHAISGGIPYLNYLLAHARHESLTLNHAIERLIFDRVPFADRGRIREFLEALALVDSVKDETIVATMIASHNDKAHPLPESEARAILREELVGYKLFRWNKAERAYIMDQTLKRLLTYYLESYQPDLAMRLHHAAVNLFADWAAAAGADEAKTRWYPLQQFHQARLNALKLQGEEHE